MGNNRKQIGFFEKYLSLWVAICIAVGIGIGSFAGGGIQVLANMEIYIAFFNNHVNYIN